MKKITKIVTFAVIPFLILAILAYDAYALIVGGSEATISSLVIRYSYEVPMFTFLMGFGPGFLAGHLFWRMRSNEDTRDIDRL